MTNIEQKLIKVKSKPKHNRTFKHSPTTCTITLPCCYEYIWTYCSWSQQ